MSLWLSVGAFVLVAVVFLLFPLFRQKSVLAGRHDEQRWPVIGVLGALPAVTVGLYLYLGAPAILQEQALTQAQASYDTDATIKALEAKLESEPADVEGWYTLGRAYIALQRLDAAEKALEKSVQLAPQEARMLSQYAEVIALKAGSLQGRSQELVMKALEIDYEDEKALELAGLAAFQQEKWAESLHFWRRLMKKLPKESEMYEAINQAVKIAETKSMAASGLGERAKLEAPEKQQKYPH